jgi:prephenate dehydratase
MDAGVTVGYPGPPGSHSDAAAAVLVPDAAVSVDLPSFSAVITAATAAEVTLGVLPIESSLVGPIAETHDLLYGSALSIVREATLPIRHCVLGLPGSRLEDATSFWSHPAAFDQCRELLAGRDVRCVPHATTADAARAVVDAGDPTHVAIASREAAAAYGLEILADDVGDSPGAFTRFVALAPYTQLGSGDGWRTALSFVTDHQPGALFRALGPLARNNVNLVQLVSRPLPNSPWRYRFDVVLDGHVFDPSVRPALLELRALTRELRLFGSYAAEVAR